jgi:hypothetical protein
MAIGGGKNQNKHLRATKLIGMQRLKGIVHEIGRSRESYNGTVG